MLKSVFASVLCSFLVGPQSIAAGLEQTNGLPAVQRVQPLRRDAASDIGLSAVEIAYLSDGRRQLSISYASERRVDAFMYYIIADPKNSSYRAFRVSGDPRRDARVIDYIRSLRSEFEARGQSHHFKEFLEAPQTDIDQLWRETIQAASEDPPPICTYCQNTCNGNGFSRAITWDPVYIELTHTDLTLNWAKQDSPTGCKWVKSGLGNCWAANPSSAGTHWYVDSCPPRYLEVAENYAFGFQAGQFHNDDFGLDSLRTWANNHATVTWNGGSSIAHGFQFSASGEWYWFLDASVAGTHYNNCI